MQCVKNSSPSTPVTIAGCFAHRRRNEFIDFDFILGSVAEVERLWSLAKYVLTDHRRQMTPQLSEALVFLKMNHRFWDARLFIEAIGGARSERAKARMDVHYWKMRILRKLLDIQEEP